MKTNSLLDITRTALVPLDCQTGIVSVCANPEADFIGRASQVLAAARQAGMPVIQVQVAFRPGFPEVSSRNKIFAAIRSSPQHQKLFQGAAGVIHPALGPEASDIVVTKHRVSAFTGTDLQMLLRAKDIETLVLFGIATSGAVLSTLLEASDADYKLIVIADCCADLDAQLHSALINKLFPQRADVLTAEEFLQALQSAQTSTAST